MHSENWPREWVQGVQEVQAVLRTWRGASAEGWAYSISHSQLLIRLFRQVEASSVAKPPVLYLYLQACRRVSFDSLWRDADIQIEVCSGKRHTEYILRDGEHLYVHCGVLPSAAESDQLLRFERPCI